VVDSQGLFIDVNIGWPGKVHDSRVLTNLSFYNKCNRGVCFPDWTKHINDVDIPLLTLGDPVYPLLYTMVDEALPRHWKLDKAATALQLSPKQSKDGGRKCLW